MDLVQVQYNNIKTYLADTPKNVNNLPISPLSYELLVRVSATCTCQVSAVCSITISIPLCRGLPEKLHLPFPIHSYEFAFPVHSNTFQNTTMNILKSSHCYGNWGFINNTKRICHLFQLTLPQQKIHFDTILSYLLLSKVYKMFQNFCCVIAQSDLTTVKSMWKLHFKKHLVK
jgi:hypothetical protein